MKSGLRDTIRPCRSCNQDIHMLRNISPDRRSDWIPVDSAAVSRGNIRIDLYRGTAEVLSGEALQTARANGDLHLAHHVTCPEADRHRGPKEKPPALFDPEEIE